MILDKDLIIKELDLVNIMKENNLTHFFDPNQKNYEKDFIYRPNDDTYFFLNVLKKEIESESKLKSLDLMCEIGTGSGLVISNFCKWMEIQG